MPYSTANIDRAIVYTQYDLRGFMHPIGSRLPRAASAKSLFFTLANFFVFASGHGKKNVIVVSEEPYISLNDGELPYEVFLDKAKRFAVDCDLMQKEAIQLLIKEFYQQWREMQSKVAAGQMSESRYLLPMEKDNWWGKAMLAMSEAFEAPLETPVA